MLTNRNAVVKGDCESCEKTDIQLYPMHGNMMLCEACRDKELEVVERNKNVNKILIESRAVDNAIQLKTDVFLAKSASLIELLASINANEAIPADMKEYAYAKECMARFKNRQQAIFEKRAELLELENEARMYQVNVQNTAGKLQAKYRDEFKEVSVNYQPEPINKKVKTTKPVKVTKAFDKTALYEAAKKYGVPAMTIRSICVSKGKSVEDAAKELAELMGITVVN